MRKFSIPVSGQLELVFVRFWHRREKRDEVNGNNVDNQRGNRGGLGVDRVTGDDSGDGESSNVNVNSGTLSAHLQ